MQNRIMRDDQDIVFRDGDIEFQRVHALFNRVFERRERILRPDGARSAVPVNQNPFCSDRSASH